MKDRKKERKILVTSFLSRMLTKRLAGTALEPLSVSQIPWAVSFLSGIAVQECTKKNALDYLLCLQCSLGPSSNVIAKKKIELKVEANLLFQTCFS